MGIVFCIARIRMARGDGFNFEEIDMTVSMNKQEIFDTVVKHLFEQKGPSISGIYCKYRHEGRKCAIGCLISDDLYKESMEGESLLSLLPRFNFPSFFRKNANLLDQLQNIHDNCWTTLKSGERAWDYPILNERLKFLAREFKLSHNVLDAEISRAPTALPAEHGVSP